jgi:hypothetical protein
MPLNITPLGMERAHHTARLACSSKTCPDLKTLQQKQLQKLEIHQQNLSKLVQAGPNCLSGITAHADHTTTLLYTKHWLPGETRVMRSSSSRKVRVAFTLVAPWPRTPSINSCTAASVIKKHC